MDHFCLVTNRSKDKDLKMTMYIKDYLEKHGDDQEIWDLWNSILDMKKEAGGNGAGGNFAGGNTYNYGAGIFSVGACIFFILNYIF